MNDLQGLFHEWNSERLGISLQESAKRMRTAEAMFDGGFAGREFRQFMVKFVGASSMFFSSEVEACENEDLPNFMRFLTYEEPEADASHPLASHLLGREKSVILDFGAGLAHSSRAIARFLIGQGQEVELVFCDVAGLKMDFLLWVCGRQSIKAKFIQCTKAMPLPRLPPCNAVVAYNILEHLADPLPYLRAFDDALSEGGLIWASLIKYRKSAEHVYPNTHMLSGVLMKMGYEQIVRKRVYRKGAKT